MSIPLTFDWLTLAWLKTRLHLWWGRRGPSVSARQLAALLLLALLAGCVPLTRFEETQSAAQVELEGRRRAEYQLAQAQAENAALRDAQSKANQSLEQREQALSQASLDSSLQGKQREDAEGVVEQLRGELARVGGHLQTFHDDKQKLEASLETEAERGRELSRLSRDAALSLSEPIATGEYTLDAEQGAIVLRVPRSKLLGTDAAVKPESEPLLKAVARALELHKSVKLRVEDSTAPGDPTAVASVVTALAARGVAAERIVPLAADAAVAKPADEPEIVLAFSVP